MRKRARGFTLILLVFTAALIVPAAASALTWSSAPTTTFSGGHALIACPTATRCIVINAGYANSFNPNDPPASQQQAVFDLKGHRALSCPTTTYCVTLGYSYQVATFVPGQPGAQTVTGLPIQATALACPSSTQCTLAGTSYSGKPEVLTIDPQDPNVTPIGSPGDVPVTPTAVSCPSTSQCAEVGGTTAVAFNPKAITSGQVRDTLAVGDLGAITCRRLSGNCIAAGYGDSIVDFNPRKLAQTATVVHTGGNSSAHTGMISCVSGTLCTAGLSDGSLLEGNPTVQGDWTLVAKAAGPITSVRCVKSGVCGAVDTQGDVFTAPAPTGTSEKSSFLHTPKVTAVGTSKLGKIVQSGGTVTAMLGCSGKKTDKCAFTLQLDVGKAIIKRTVTIKTGTQKVALTLPPAARKAIAGGKKVPASLSVSQSVFGGSVVLAVDKLTLHG